MKFPSRKVHDVIQCHLFPTLAQLTPVMAGEQPSTSPEMSSTEIPLMSERRERKYSSRLAALSLMVTSIMIFVGGRRTNGAKSAVLIARTHYAKPFVEDGSKVDASVFQTAPLYQFRLAWGGTAANLTAATSLCSEFDDDFSFPSEVCDCGDARTQCNDDMLRLPKYYSLCFEAACGSDNMDRYAAYPSDNAIEKCAGLIRPAWGVPCAWQAVKRLPETCAETFTPSPPLGSSRDVPNKYPLLTSEQRWALGYEETFAGPCNAHAFCFTCLDADYELGVNPYCRAVFARYGATPEAPAEIHDSVTGHVVLRSFFSELDSFWCQRKTLHQLALFEQETRRGR